MASKFGGVPVEENPQPTRSKFGGEPVTDAALNAAATQGSVAGLNAQAAKRPDPYHLRTPIVADPNREDAGTAIAEKTLGTMGESMRTLGRGLHGVVHPGAQPLSRTAADIVEGGGSVALPFALPGIVSAIRSAPLPFLGGAAAASAAVPAARETARQFGAGDDTQRIVGDLAGAASMFGGAAVAPRLRMGSLSPFSVNPAVAVTRALGPLSKDPDFAAAIPDTLRRIKAMTPGENPASISGGKVNLLSATERAIGQHQDALEPFMTRAKGVNVPGDALVEAAERAIPALDRTRDPGGVRAVIDRVRAAFGGKTFPVEAFKDWLRTANADLNRFYRQSPDAQQTGVFAGSTPAIEKSMADAIRESLYRAIDPEGQGANVRTIQGASKNLMNFRDAAASRAGSMIAQEPLSPMESFLRPVKRLLPFGGSSKTAALGSLSSDGRSIPLLRRAFDAVGNEPLNVLPRPASELYPVGDTRRLLGPGDRMMPSPPDSSFVRSTPGMAQPTNPARALPAGPGRIFAGEPPPDTSFVRGVGAMANGPNPARALPQAPDIRITDLPADMSYVRGVPPAPHQQVSMERPMLPPGRAPFTQGTVVPDILGRPGQSSHRLIEGPLLPEIPTGQGVHEVPPSDTSGIRVMGARPQFGTDPKTGRKFKFFTSDPER